MPSANESHAVVGCSFYATLATIDFMTLARQNTEEFCGPCRYLSRIRTKALRTVAFSRRRDWTVRASAENTFPFKIESFCLMTCFTTQRRPVGIGRGENVDTKSIANPPPHLNQQPRSGNASTRCRTLAKIATLCFIFFWCKTKRPFHGLLGSIACSAQYVSAVF